jgi:tRNA (guanine37-N1)-methyltransferase
MDAILPEDSLAEVPSGFQAVGHIAHLNMRDAYLPYKTLIAAVLLDKNPHIRTVINKTDTVGDESEYRTFSYEVLAGPHDMDVTAREQGCEFRFNYARVYWNSRLNTEHERLVAAFSPGEAVCDVMAGIGPFAVPAGRKRVFVWANDLNPHSHAHLAQNVRLNRVEAFVRPFNEDGRAFIEKATAELWTAEPVSVALPRKKPPRRGKPWEEKLPSPPPPTLVPRPRTFAHFVMNLPATAVTFLPAFVGLYARVGIPRSEPRPRVHVYCFVKKADEAVADDEVVRRTVSDLLGFEFRLGGGKEEGEIKVTDVRDVGPNKRMFCASFVLPEDVAYRKDV